MLVVQEQIAGWKQKKIKILSYYFIVFLTFILRIGGNKWNDILLIGVVEHGVYVVDGGVVLLIALPPDGVQGHIWSNL